MTDQPLVIKHEAQKEPRFFVIDDDKFYVADPIPASAMQKAAEFDGMDLGKDVAKILELTNTILNMVLQDESAQLFQHRLESKTNPIGIEDVVAVIQWIFRSATDFPTSPSSPSPVGQQEGGNGSVVIASSAPVAHQLSFI